MEAATHELSRFQIANREGNRHGVSITKNKLPFLQLPLFMSGHGFFTELCHKKSASSSSVSWNRHSQKSKSHANCAIWTAKSSSASSKAISGCSCVSERINLIQTAITQPSVSCEGLRVNIFFSKQLILMTLRLLCVSAAVCESIKNPVTEGILFEWTEHMRYMDDSLMMPPPKRH